MKSLLPLAEDEEVAALLSVRGLDQEGHLVFATERGLVKRTALKEYQNLGQAGLIAIRLQEGDRLVGVALSDPEDEAILPPKRARPSASPWRRCGPRAGTPKG